MLTVQTQYLLNWIGSVLFHINTVGFETRDTVCVCVRVIVCVCVCVMSYYDSVILGRFLTYLMLLRVGSWEDRGSVPTKPVSSDTWVYMIHRGKLSHGGQLTQR